MKNQAPKKDRRPLYMVFAAILLVVLVLCGCLVYAANRRAKQAEAASLALVQAQQAAEQRQAEMEAQRAAEEAAALAAQQAAEAEARRQTEALKLRDAVQNGDEIGRIWVEDTQLDCPLYWGDTGSQFRNGAGAHATDGCVLPGEQGTLFIGGHTDSWFVDLKSAKIGSIIHVETPWGDYTYRVADMQKVTENDLDACHWGATEESCILYTCYPFGIQTPTIYRWLVYANPITLPAAEEATQP